MDGDSGAALGVAGHANMGVTVPPTLGTSEA